MTKYLVPLDGSELAEQALPYAKERIARLPGSSLVIVRVVNTARQLASAAMSSGIGMETPSPLSMDAIDAAVQAEKQEAQQYLERKAMQLRLEGLQVEWAVREGTAAEEIIGAAKDHSTEVIVITTHGRSGIGRVVFGSVADKVIRDGGIPVLVIKAK